ncbi:MAG: glycosyltransferase [Bacteroidia bacterium]|nr:glycosyltransferase [Bacteroidia bacterium]
MISLALISINRNKYSETFIHNHVKRLPVRVHYFTGGYFPTEVSEGWEGIPVSLDGRFRSGGIFGWPNVRISEKERVKNYIKKHQISAVLAEYGPSGVEMMEICREMGLPLIVHFHGYDAYRNDMLAAYGGRYPELFRQAAAIIAVSRHMQSHLIDLGADPAKVHYTPCGPDEKLFTQADPGQNPPHFLAVGRFAETKCPQMTIRAFARVVAEIPEARLTFCGSGHLEEACNLLANELKIQTQVDFRGVLRHEEIAQQMLKARAFVQHSITTSENDLEGTPVSIQEAGLAGLPVVSTRHGGIVDVVVEGKTGFLGPENDLQSMAYSMLKLARDPNLAASIGAAAHQHIQQNFTLDLHLQKLWQVIESVL